TTSMVALFTLMVDPPYTTVLPAPTSNWSLLAPVRLIEPVPRLPPAITRTRPAWLTVRAANACVADPAIGTPPAPKLPMTSWPPATFMVEPLMALVTVALNRPPVLTVTVMAPTTFATLAFTMPVPFTVTPLVPVNAELTFRVPELTTVGPT